MYTTCVYYGYIWLYVFPALFVSHAFRKDPDP